MSARQATATDGLRLEFLGGVQVSRQETPLAGFVSSKAVALLAYLAIVPGAQSREVLAGWFWGEAPEADARASLRVVLTNLRQTVGREHFESDRKTVAFNRRPPYWLDVEAFEAHMRSSAIAPDGAAGSWRLAVELYRGDLLAGITVSGVPAFDEWLSVRREHLRQLAVRALDGLAEHAAAAGAHAEGIDWLARLLEIDPWREDAHRRLMILLVHGGRRNDALIQYEKCRRLLDDDLGIEPEAETVQLYERILAGELHAERPVLAASAPPGPAIDTGWRRRPGPRTSFIGREVELAQIISALDDPACRLLTLVGPGGIGKSRLALEAVADRRVGFRDGMHVVPLAPIGTPDLIAPSIAAAIGVNITDSGHPLAQLSSFLRDKTMLLVLDNFEHLIDGAPLLNELLDAAPGARVLVTSRERLALSAEWLITLYGLPVPDETTEADIALSPAVRLFVERARQVQPGFTLSGPAAASVARICRMLDGMPLAIELAAAWTRTHACGEIEASIAENLDFLTAQMRDVPARHHSLRAVFQHSWDLLDERARTIFQGLAVFRGGFPPTAAAAAAGASQADLLQLVDKSLLYRDQSGRYALHELLRQYAYERLDSSPDAGQAHERHAAFFAGFLQASEPNLRGLELHDAVRNIRADIDNIRAAWQWAVARSELPVMSQALDGLQTFIDITGRLREGVEALEQAISAVQARAAHDVPRDPELDILLGRLLGWSSRHAMSSGHFKEAEALIERSQALLERHGRTRDFRYALDTMAMLANAAGRQAEALRLQQAALAAAESDGDLIGKSLAYRGLAGIAFDTGNFPDAGVWFRRSLKARQDIGDWDGAAREHYRVGEVARLTGNFVEARRQNEVSRAIQRELGSSSQRMIPPLVQHGELSLDLGRLDDAERYFQQAREIAIQTDMLRSLALILRGLADVMSLRDMLDEACMLVEEALSITREHGYILGIMRCLQSQALIAAQAGDWRQSEMAGNEALAIAETAGNQYHVGRAETILSRVATARGDFSRAGQLVDSAYARLTRTGARPAVLDAAASRAGLLAAEADASGGAQLARERATELLNTILHDPAIWFDTRQRADSLLAGLVRLVGDRDQGPGTREKVVGGSS